MFLAFDTYVMPVDALHHDPIVRKAGIDGALQVRPEDALDERIQ